MITGKMEYKKKKLTLEEKSLRKRIKPFAKRIKDQVKADAPRDTGALAMSVGFKIMKKRGCCAVIGVRSKFGKNVRLKRRGRKIFKIPNLYAIKTAMKQVIGKYVNQAAVDELREQAKDAVQEMLNK